MEEIPVATARPAVALAANRQVLDGILASPNLERIRALGDIREAEFDRPWGYVEPPPPDAESDRRLIELVG